MKNIIGNIRFGGNALNFSFCEGKMDMDVLTERAFTEDEVKTVNSVIDDLVHICVKLEKNIRDYSEVKGKSFTWLRKFILTKKELKKEKNYTLGASDLKFSSRARRFPAPDSAGTFYIELNGIRLIEENGEIVGWMLL